MLSEIGVIACEDSMEDLTGDSNTGSEVRFISNLMKFMMSFESSNYFMCMKWRASLRNIFSTILKANLYFGYKHFAFVCHIIDVFQISIKFIYYLFQSRTNCRQLFHIVDDFQWIFPPINNFKAIVPMWGSINLL